MWAVGHTLVTTSTHSCVFAAAPNFKSISESVLKRHRSFSAGRSVAKQVNEEGEELVQ